MPWLSWLKTMLSRAKFQLKASPHLALVAGVVWLALSLCGWGILGNVWLALAYALFAGGMSWYWVWRWALLKSSTSVVAVSWTADDFCCYLKNGEQVSGQIMPKSAFNPYFITLYIRLSDGQQFWWPLLADSGAPDMLRKLRVFGRWHIQIPTANQN